MRLLNYIKTGSSLLSLPISLGLLVISCQKNNDPDPELPPLTFSVVAKLAVNGTDIVLTWTKAKNPTGDPVTYSVVYQDTLVKNLTDTTYTFQKGSYDVIITGSVIAKNNHSAFTSVPFTVSVDNNSSSPETIRFVKPNDGRDLKNGLSWATAYDQTQLQTAINSLSVTGGQVWVAQGVYKPTTDSKSRHISFAMRKGVAVYGGFFLDPTLLQLRNPVRFPTILSGDIDGDGTLANNSYSVIVNKPYSKEGEFVYTIDSTAVLDGFVITGGNADQLGFSSGGDVSNYTGCTPTIANCIITGNTASYGGGVSNQNAYNPRFINCLISNNSAAKGGGMYNYSGSPRLINCIIRDNIATAEGGGLSNQSGSFPVLTNCTIVGNSAQTAGGGALSNYYFCGPKLFNCILWNNGGQLAIVNQYYGNYSNGTYDVSADHCLIEFETNSYVGSNNLKAIVSPFSSFTSLQLLPGSQAIDGGSNEAYSRWGGPPIDFTGNSRIINRLIDLGAIEYR